MFMIDVMNSGNTKPNHQRGGIRMSQEKSPEELRVEKEKLKMENQKTENVFEDKSRVPDEQHAWKETQFKYGE